MDDDMYDFGGSGSTPSYSTNNTSSYSASTKHSDPPSSYSSYSSSSTTTTTTTNNYEASYDATFKRPNASSPGSSAVYNDSSSDTLAANAITDTAATTAAAAAAPATSTHPLGFCDVDVPPLTIQSEWRRGQRARSMECQTNEILTSEIDTQSTPTESVATPVAPTAVPATLTAAVKTVTDIESPSEFLIQLGLTESESKFLVNELGATTKEDYYLIDYTMAAEATKSFKPIPRKRAIEALLSAGSSARVPVSSSTMSESTTSDETKTAAAPATPPDEFVAICIDHSGSMGCGFDEIKSWNDDGNARALQKVIETRSRMDAVKQVFYAFRDRTETLGAAAKHHLGLIQFDSEVETLLQLTSSLDLFEEIVDDIEKRGSTSIYSAIIEALPCFNLMWLRPRLLIFVSSS